MSGYVSRKTGTSSHFMNSVLSALRLQLSSHAGPQPGLCVLRDLSPTGKLMLEAGLQLSVAPAMALVFCAVGIGGWLRSRLRWHCCCCPQNADGGNGAHHGTGGGSGGDHAEGSVVPVPTGAPSSSPTATRTASGRSTPTSPTAGTHGSAQTGGAGVGARACEVQPLAIAIAPVAPRRLCAPRDLETAAREAAPPTPTPTLTPTLRGRLLVAAIQYALLANSVFLIDAVKLVHCVPVPGAPPGQRNLFLEPSLVCDRAGWQAPYVVLLFVVGMVVVVLVPLAAWWAREPPVATPDFPSPPPTPTASGLRQALLNGSPEAPVSPREDVRPHCNYAARRLRDDLKLAVHVALVAPYRRKYWFTTLWETVLLLQRMVRDQRLG
jgi:hypothetical protein